MIKYVEFSIKENNCNGYDFCINSNANRGIKTLGMPFTTNVKHQKVSIAPYFNNYINNLMTNCIIKFTNKDSYAEMYDEQCNLVAVMPLYLIKSIKANYAFTEKPTFWINLKYNGFVKCCSININTMEALEKEDGYYKNIYKLYCNGELLETCESLEDAQYKIDYYKHCDIEAYGAVSNDKYNIVKNKIRA